MRCQKSTEIKKGQTPNGVVKKRKGGSSKGVAKKRRQTLRGHVW